MADPISFGEKNTVAWTLADLGYRDYIAARLLLNNHLVVQGLTLASTAVEKYLKAIIVLGSDEKVKLYAHLDNFEKIKNLLRMNQQDVINYLDPHFLLILENAFKIRYYDRLKEPICIGFYLNQFVGELDHTIDFFENEVLHTKNGISHYRQAIKRKDKHLLKNNFVLNGMDKKEYMERLDIGYSVCINVRGAMMSEDVVKGGNYRNVYDGRIGVFNFRNFPY